MNPFVVTTIISKQNYAEIIKLNIGFTIFLVILTGLYNPFKIYSIIALICFEGLILIYTNTQNHSNQIKSHILIGAKYIIITIFCVLSGGINSPLAIFLVSFPLIYSTWTGNILEKMSLVSHCCWVFLWAYSTIMETGNLSGCVKSILDFDLEFVRLLCYMVAGYGVYIVSCSSNAILVERTNDALKESEHKTHFVAMMSHEIRTPLTTILGWTDILMASDLKTDVRKYLEIIKASSTHLLSVINDILDITKIQAGKLSFDNEPFDLLTLVESTKDYMTVLMRDQVEYKISYQITKARYVRGDAHRLLQCIYNFLSNSSKFTHSGSITLHVKESTIDDNARISFSITDTGIGMSKDVLTRLFSAYEQGERSITRKYGGHGLGMTITKQLVEMMDGKIDVNSTPNKGTTFRFYVILGLVSSKDFRRHSQKMENPISFKKLNILLVEDNKLNQKLMECMLQQIGHKCTVANDGMEAIDLSNTQYFDIILMDVYLPSMTGLEVCKKIKEDNGLCKNTPIIALTASADPWTKAAVSEAGMSGFVAKPVSLDELRKMLNCMASTLQTIEDYQPSRKNSKKLL